MTNQVLKNRYLLEEKIGSGGMADVYLAEDKLLHRKVAVKILHEEYWKDAEFVGKFHKEAEAAARLSHPNIVNIYDVGNENDAHYIVMEYVAGNTLKSLIKEKGRLSVAEAVHIAREIAEALSQAHSEGIVHCDIKPHNILMMENGHAKIADFGIARAVTESTLTYGGNIVGSVHYFSPEQAKGTYITPKSDIYSLGIIMYEMITGKLPFTGDTPVAIAMKHLSDAPQPLRSFDNDIPPIVEAIVMRAIEKDPNMRPTSAELTRELQEAEHLLHGNTSGSMVDPFATRIMPKFEDLDDTYGGGEIKKKTKNTDSIFQSKLFIAVLVAILVMGFCVGAFISYGKFWSAEEVNVPNVVGKQMTLARQILEDAHLRVNVAETYDASVPAGEVVSQSPEAGARVKSERLVSIYVSKGGESLELPDLKGLSRTAAENRLKKMGLSVGTIDEKVSREEPGTVLLTDPSAHTKIQKGMVIDLVISKGEQKKRVTVPNVTGATLEAATESIKNKGLSVGRVIKEKSKERVGTVIAQTPAQGEVEEGSSVDLTIAEKDTGASTDSTETKSSHESKPAAEDKKENEVPVKIPPAKGTGEGKSQ
ncbi:MAG: Stk1 family PASTA domain-containing Ser/Thr kinase [Selenomonadaceae bacterium]|nr:Stk1 family PASTA domain-containing Ser/Thr kinase [Selenomonadaceae bacterium]